MCVEELETYLAPGSQPASASPIIATISHATIDRNLVAGAAPSGRGRETGRGGGGDHPALQLLQRLGRGLRVPSRRGPLMPLVPRRRGWLAWLLRPPHRPGGLWHPAAAPSPPLGADVGLLQQRRRVNAYDARVAQQRRLAREDESGRSF